MRYSNKEILSVLPIATLVLAVFFGGGYYIGTMARPVLASIPVENKEVPPEIAEKDVEQGDFDIFWNVWKLVDEKFVGIKDITTKQKIEGATKGLVESLGDDYSLFFDEKEAEYFNQNLSGEFGGVGMEVGIRDGLITVISPLKDTPAYRAGIIAGDVLISIDGVSATDMGIDEAVKLIRGEVGTEVTLAMYREQGQEKKDFTLERAVISVPTIETSVSDDVFIIELFSFSEQSPLLFQTALQEFIDSGEKYLILDLRGNPGGFLEASRDIASWFLPEGKPIVIEQYADGSEIVHRSRGFDVFKEGLPFVVLVDGGSASASEILAGALQDYGIATIVGTKTFGKGSVQELIPVKQGGSLKVTVAKWFTPERQSISEGGLTPDVLIEATEEEILLTEDLFLEKAIEVVKKK